MPPLWPTRLELCAFSIHTWPTCPSQLIPSPFFPSPLPASLSFQLPWTPARPYSTFVRIREKHPLISIC